MSRRRLIVCADDFGLDRSVNAAVERAHRDGILTCASLMVGAPAAADAVERAHRLPRLGVGLHLVVASGMPMLPSREIPALAGGKGALGDALVGAGVRFFFHPGARRELAREVRAQFEAFRATGLALDHANAHRHMHLHPTVARLLIAIGGEYGLACVRIPQEPLAPLRRAGASAIEVAFAAAHAPLAAALRRRVRRAGMFANDRLLGLAWTGALNEERVLRLLSVVPAGASELYFHPSEGNAELEALLSPAVRRRIEADGIALAAYSEFSIHPTRCAQRVEE